MAQVLFHNVVGEIPNTWTVMVHPPTLHVLLKPCLHLQWLSLFLNLSDQPLTHLGLVFESPVVWTKKRPKLNQVGPFATRLSVAVAEGLGKWQL